MLRTRRIGIVGPTDTIVAIDETTAGGVVKVTGRAFVNNANDLFNGIQTIRWNRSRLIRLRGYTANGINLLCQGIPGGEQHISVQVNGVLFTTVIVANATAVPAWYAVYGMPSGSKTIEIREDFQDRSGSQLNTNADGSALATYVLKVAVPSGQPLPVAPRASVGIAAFGDSHMDGIATIPCSVNGWVGQLRTAAEAAGWELGYVGAGSSTLCGDGPSAVQTAAMISTLWAQMGSTTKKFLMCRRPNDYAYWNVSGFTTTPTQYGQYIKDIQTALDASDPGWTGIYTRIPQGTTWAANAGGFTLADYWTATASAATNSGRTNVQTFDGSVDVSGIFGLILASDYTEAPNSQVHPKQSGEDKIFAVARTWYGL